MLAEELQGFESEYNKDIFAEATNVLTSIDHQLQQLEILFKKFSHSLMILKQL